MVGEQPQAGGSLSLQGLGPTGRHPDTFLLNSKLKPHQPGLAQNLSRALHSSDSPTELGVAHPFFETLHPFHDLRFLFLQRLARWRSLMMLPL